MNEPTQEQRAAAARLGVSLAFVDTPVTVAKLVQLIEDLQQRIAELEQKQTGAGASWSLRRK
jgi:hypothetical protein